MLRFIPLLLTLVACVDDHVTEIGSSIFTSEVRKVVLDNRGGGYGPFSPPDAACDVQKAKYTLSIGEHLLAWEYCDGFPDGPYTPVASSRTLGDTEWTELEPALRALVVAGGDLCGADRPMVALIVTTTDDLEYGDAFYGCQIHDRPLIATDGLSAYEAAVRDLARE